MASKNIIAEVKLQIPGGKATPAPPIGPALAPHGINISDFCQRFNEASESQIGWVLPVKVLIYEDRTFDFSIKQPTVSEFLKKAAGIEKGSGEPNREKVGKITRDKLREIAEKKMPDLNTRDIEKAMRIVEGTAKNMGIEIG